MLNKVKLANGTEVDWEVFCLWSNKKQLGALIPVSEETRSRLRAAKANMDCSRSPETREKIRQAIAARLASGWKPNGAKSALKLRGRKRPQEVTDQIMATRKARGLIGKGALLARGIKPHYKNAHSIQTPFGLFVSKAQATEAWSKMGIRNARNKLAEALIKDPNNFYLIEKKD
ncbi:hypothetical protein G6716_04880 [Polynucleobacter paneuropaeus]|nr:hypothetical protein G6716_04880 [Polynucleobacter paneuropaeus]